MESVGRARAAGQARVKLGAPAVRLPPPTLDLPLQYFNTPFRLLDPTLPLPHGVTRSHRRDPAPRRACREGIAGGVSRSSPLAHRTLQDWQEGYQEGYATLSRCWGNRRRRGPVSTTPLSLNQLTTFSRLAAYLAGKREALSDVLEFITSLDHPAAAGGPLNAARLIDYICVGGPHCRHSFRGTDSTLSPLQARQETLKAEEEGEDDDAETTQPVRPATAHQAHPSMFPPRPSTTHRSTTTAPSSSSAPLSTPVSTSTASTSHLPRTRPDGPPSTSPTASPQPHFAAHLLPHSLSTSSFGSTHSSASTSSLAANLSLPFTTPSSPLASPANGTRLQARREREHRDRKGKNVGTLREREREAAVVGVTNEIVGLKRRWGSVAMAEVELGGEGIEGVEEEGESGSEVEGEPMEMEVGEMEGWDGIGERPAKRVVRRSLGV